MTTISSNQECFDSEIHDFQEALKDAGYCHKLSFGHKSSKKGVKGRLHNNRNFKHYSGEQNSVNSSRKSRDIIYFTPPFNLYCGTNVGEEFRKIVEKHFSRGDDLSKLFNRNKLKLSYSCLPNIQAKIASHNKKMLSKPPPASIVSRHCNCQKNKICPLDG